MVAYAGLREGRSTLGRQLLFDRWKLAIVQVAVERLPYHGKSFSHPLAAMEGEGCGL